MSIEQHLKELAEAVKANTEALMATVAQRSELVKKAENLAAKTVTAEAKPAKVKAAEAPKAKPENNASTLRTRFGAFLSVTNATEKENRMGLVEAMLDRYGVAKATEISEDDTPKVLSILDKAEKGVYPSWFTPEPAEDEEDEDEKPAAKAKKKKAVDDDDEDEDEDDKPVAKAKKKKTVVADDEDEDDEE